MAEGADRPESETRGRSEQRRDPGRGPAPGEAEAGAAAPAPGTDDAGDAAAAGPPAPAAAGEEAGAQAAEEAGADDEEAQRRRKKKFRETLWFKKGETPDDAPADGPGEGAGEDAGSTEAPPLETRYRDDGTVTDEDHARLTLRTGHTETAPAYKDDGAPGALLPEKELVRDLSQAGGHRALVIVIVVIVVAGSLAGYLLGGC